MDDHLCAFQNSAPFKTNMSESAMAMGFYPSSLYKRT
jgi:hypothetical protein